MTPTEIIRADAEKDGFDIKAVLSFIKQSIENKTGYLMREGDSVLFIKLINQNSAELYLYTQDRPISVGKAIVKFIDALRKTNIHNFYMSGDMPQISALVKYAGAEIEPSDNPDYKTMMRL